MRDLKQGVLISNLLKRLLLPREISDLRLQLLDFLMAREELGRVVLILEFQLLAEFDQVSLVGALGQAEGRE